MTLAREILVGPRGVTRRVRVGRLAQGTGRKRSCNLAWDDCVSRLSIDVPRGTGVKRWGPFGKTKRPGKLGEFDWWCIYYAFVCLVHLLRTLVYAYMLSLQQQTDRQTDTAVGLLFANISKTSQ